MNKNLNIDFSLTKERQTSSVLLVDYFEDVPFTFGERFPEGDIFYELVKPAFETGDFQGKYKQTCMIYTYGKMPETRILLLGLGKKEEVTPFKIKVAFAHALNILQSKKVNSVTTYIDKKCNENEFCSISEFLAEASYLSQYIHPCYKKDKEEDKQFIEKINLLLPENTNESDYDALEQSMIKGKYTGSIINEVRYMINTPSNFMTPSKLADYATELSKTLPNVYTEVFDRKQIETMGMGGLLNVGKGSTEPLYFIKCSYTPLVNNGHTVALVGKGITFDAGGICVKPSQGMYKMKDDMSGAAIVLGLIKLAASLNLPIKLMALIPTCENLPSAMAYKPGDVLTCLDGTTVEVQDTDAEGRLILMDALAYAVQQKADIILDLATLTGACTIALGRYTIGGITNCQTIMDLMTNCGDDLYERIWQLPSLPEYKTLLKSLVADMKNCGGREGSTITAGMFLKHFVGKTPWIHLDIAGVSWFDQSNPLIPEGASGIGLRLVSNFLQCLAINDDDSIWKAKVD